MKKKELWKYCPYCKSKKIDQYLYKNNNETINLWKDRIKKSKLLLLSRGAYKWYYNLYHCCNCRGNFYAYFLIQYSIGTFGQNILKVIIIKVDSPANINLFLEEKKI
jgi:hypothetical protein